MGEECVCVEGDGEAGEDQESYFGHCKFEIPSTFYRGDVH